MGKICRCGCSVCLVSAAETMVQLRCNHVFCEPCIKEWGASHKLCPLCRKDLFGIDQKNEISCLVMDKTTCSAEEAFRRGDEIATQIYAAASPMTYFRSYGFTDFLVMAYYAFGTHGAEVQRQYRSILQIYMRYPQYIPGLSVGQQHKISYRVMNTSRRSALGGKYHDMSDSEFTELFRGSKDLQNEIWNVMNRESWDEWSSRILDTIIEDSTRLFNMVWP
jgi:hypothetical protein